MKSFLMKWKWCSNPFIRNITIVDKIYKKVTDNAFCYGVNRTTSYIECPILCFSNQLWLKLIFYWIFDSNNLIRWCCAIFQEKPSYLFARICNLKNMLLLSYWCISPSLGELSFVRKSKTLSCSYKFFNFLENSNFNIFFLFNI